MTLPGLRLHCYSNLAYSGEASWGVENSCLCSEILLVHHLGEYPGYLMVGDPPRAVAELLLQHCAEEPAGTSSLGCGVLEVHCREGGGVCSLRVD